ncbi:hypothetical protein SUGI_0422530 [Cryptomeria japonica]|nr:hypothetical protein SUGI_0422530 [Cryptomeria japonica]
MASSFSFSAPSILFTNSLKLIPRQCCMCSTRGRIRLSSGSLGFHSKIKAAAGSNRRENALPNPADLEPPEASDDEEEELTKFGRVEAQAAKLRKKEAEEYERKKHIFLAAVADEEQTAVVEGNDPEIIRPEKEDFGDDFFAEVDKAVALRRSELIKEGVLNVKQPQQNKEIDDLEEEEVGDVEEIEELQDLAAINELTEEEGQEVEGLSRDTAKVISQDVIFNEDEFLDPPDLQILEPEFSMTLAELLDEAKIIPVSVDGDLEVVITGIQHDSQEVNPGDLFVCCTGSSTNGHIYLTEAVKRGALAIIVSEEISIQEIEGVKAIITVEDGNAILPALAVSFYKNPSQKLTVMGLTGTNGKTTTTYLIKSIYETMGLKIGLLGTIDYYIHSNLKLDASLTTPDALNIQKLMAKMVYNGAEVCVMEASSQGLAQGRCDKVDFDIAVFMNLTRDHMDYHKTEDEYKKAKGKLFANMIDPERHRKVVNIDDPSASYFIAQGNPDVPVITFSMGNKNAYVHALQVDLSLFETQVLISTPEGNLEISSGLLGRHNVYNILAAVAVGIAVGAPLQDIVNGIEEVDAVPGRMELIDEEQAFAVIVDYAHTPDALGRLLDTVRECGAKRIITVFGCGGDRDRGKRPLMTKIATDKSDVCILTSDNPRTEDPLDILDDMLAGVGWTMEEYLKYNADDCYPPLPNGHRLFVYDIRSVAVRAGVAMGEEGDAVVIAGKGHETYQIVGEEKKFLDDRNECREALQYVDAIHAAGIDTSEFPWRFPESY